MVLNRDMDSINRRVVLRAHPQGLVRDDDLAIEQGPVPQPDEGQLLVRNHWLSVDPMIRIFIDAAPLGGSVPPMPIGTTVPGPAVGQVIRSNRPDFAVGDWVEGRLGWQDYALSSGQGLNRIDPDDGPVELALGMLGLPGFSAFVGLDVAGPLAQGTILLVSGAAGAVGSAVGALARARGLHAIGIASGPGKCAWLRKTGYADAVDRTAPDFAEQLARAVGDRVDLYFDNVGGPMMDSVLPLMKRGGQVLICGLMAQYDDMVGREGGGHDRLPAFLAAVMARGLIVKAFANIDHLALRPAFLAEMGAIIRADPAIARVHVTQGMEQVPAAFRRLFTDSVVGKSLVRI